MNPSRIIIGLGVSILLAACAPNQFSVDSDCNKSAEGHCINGSGSSNYSDSFTVGGGKLDILIVNDNSASMSTEQKQLANRFGNLIASMDAQKIEYRVAMATTDISSSKNPARSVNQNGALQDGKLITFTGGKKYISWNEGTAQSRTSAFAQAVQRPETLSCEAFITNWVNAGKSTNTSEYTASYNANCPSTDERGIYAARLSLENNDSGFLRKDADLAVIFLADEDERSQYYWYNTPGFELEDKDKGVNLNSYIKQTFPQKKFGLHSIVVTNEACLSQQSQQLNGAVSGSYGKEYANASYASGGIIGNICASDYSGIMSAIFSNITVNLVDKIALGCGNPTNLNVTNSAGIGGQVVGMAYVFNQKLPVGTQVSYSYTCKASAQ